MAIAMALVETGLADGSNFKTTPASAAEAAEPSIASSDNQGSRSAPVGLAKMTIPTSVISDPTKPRTRNGSMP